MTGEKNDTGTFVSGFYPLSSPEKSVINFGLSLYISHMFIIRIPKGNNYYCFPYKL